VETAAHGSEFVAGRAATEQVIDIRHTLRMMGVKIDGPTCMFGDNQSVITSSTMPRSMLGKRHKRSDCSWRLKDVPCGWKAEPERRDDEVLGAFSVLSFDQVFPFLEGTCRRWRLISESVFECT
jgi:hypothetical protein